MRTREQRLLNAVQRPDVYEELLIESRGVPIALSIWKGNTGAPCIVFLPGTMTHPLFYEELLDSLSRAGFNVVGVHYLGHGKSPRLEQLFSFNDLVQNGRDAISYATQRFKSSIVVLGSSQGGMVASLFSTKMGFLRSGQIRCPVVVIASTGDPLFPFDVVQRLYQEIKAPSKELLVFDLNYHLLFNECLDAVLPPLVETLKRYADKYVRVTETSGVR